MASEISCGNIIPDYIVLFGTCTLTFTARYTGQVVKKDLEKEGEGPEEVGSCNSIIRSSSPASLNWFKLHSEKAFPLSVRAGREP